MSARIFIIDDDVGYANALARHLRRAGHEVETCATAAEAREQLKPFGPDVVVLDQELPDGSGVELLDELKTAQQGAVFLVVTAYPDVDFAVTAMRSGAFDYLGKGADPRECLIRIERASEVSSLRRRVVEAHSEPPGAGDMGLIGNSAPMVELRARLGALAASDDTTVLITGETGTGKGLVARAIYTHSKRAYDPFVAVDCTTIPVNLVESELFGHERGAFSGATSSKPGRVEAAGRGTLFLDEIGELELPVQAKLLRLLEEREYTRVGSTTTRNLRARIITATNRDLERAVEEGRFRADLRFRLEVFVVEVPPLRERGEDVFLIAEHYARERARGLGRSEPHMTDELREALLRYPFPGNVRELKNMVEQAVLLAGDDELTLQEFPVLSRFGRGWLPPAPSPHGSWQPPSSALAERLGRRALRPWQEPPAMTMPKLPADVARLTAPFGAPVNTQHHPPPGEAGQRRAQADAAAPSDPAMSHSLDGIRRKHDQAEKERLVEALEASGGNVSAAARNVGISRYQMLRRLTKYGLR